ncbi:DUF4232 domain-containing protein [Phycicoccus avicenniae]|uniref:DUF4232 domain-containing protein n=1 Tax=Phycicoccus avicenniae TaxID=2828860 RepID=UPI003D296F01
MHTTAATHRTVRTASAVTAALASLVLLSGCGNGLESGGRASGTGLSPGPSPTSSSSASPSATPTESSPAPSDAATPTDGSTGASTATSGGSGTTGAEGTPARCTVGHLAVGLRTPAGSGAAGSTYLLLTFRNTGGSACRLSGFPGVSFVGKGDGTQIGAPAARTGSAVAVTLAPDASTTALLRVVDAGVYPSRSCAPTTADGLRVYPPGSTDAAYVARPLQACQGSTGDSPQLTVSSVGTRS